MINETNKYLGKYPWYIQRGFYIDFPFLSIILAKLVEMQNLLTRKERFTTSECHSTTSSPKIQVIFPDGIV